MSQVTIGSFGERTLDALLDAENSGCRKNNSQLLKTIGNARFCGSPFAPLEEIDDDLLAGSPANNPTVVRRTVDKRVAETDVSDIANYFQDSEILSRFGTSELEAVDVSDGNTGTGSTTVTRSQRKIVQNRKPDGLRKFSAPTSKSKRDRIESWGKRSFVESSEDQDSNKPRSQSESKEPATGDGEGFGITIAPNLRSVDNDALLDNKSNDAGQTRDGTDDGRLLSADKTAINIDISNEASSKRSDRRIKIRSRTANSHADSAAESSSRRLTVGAQDRCKLSAWGLPPDILQIYEARGMGTMFSWQAECLSNYRVLEESKNLVYSAPTSAGKTLIAEMLVAKTVLERRKKALIILPFVSVVREKMFYFQDLLSSSGIRVEGFMGGIAPAGGLAAAHIAIATIEKANSLINRLMEEGGLSSLGAVVVDELHLLGDPHRGYLLELLLTKLKYMTLREEHIKIQLIGMSATLPNLSLLAEWLDAELFSTDFRPVPLNERYKINSTIYDDKFTPVRELNTSPELPNDPDHILQLCIETLAGGHSTLIFCPTKNWCEKLAHQVAAIFFQLGSGGTALGKILREQLNSNAIEETLSQLKRCPAGLDGVLKSTVSFGVAFHHAGLTMDERDIIEGSFRTGSLRVLVATSTLSSGVNLPARRVIVRSLMFHGKTIDTLAYRQMIGRAGRMGKDTAGESILMCKPNEKIAAESLLSAPLDPVESCLEGSGPLVRALLEAVAGEIACTSSDIDLYVGCTLASFKPASDMAGRAREAMEFLTSNEFVVVQETKEKEGRWVATALGRACLASSVSPGDGLFLFEELQRARKCFVLETELHIVYLVTPFNSGGLNGQIDWMIFFNLWKSLSECERRVGQMVGIEERYLMSAIRGVAREGRQQSIHRRFFTALALHDLVREIPLTAVARKYGCSRGVLQSLQQSASTLAGMVTQFCKQLGWDCMELLFSQFQARLQFGVCRELLDLLRLPMLNGLRARSLYREGVRCVADLAVADELKVECALHKALPFESEKEQDGEHALDAARRTKVRSIFVTGRDGLTPYQAAVLLVQEARTLVQNELGVKEVNWKQDDSHSNVTRSSHKSFPSIPSIDRHPDESHGSPPKSDANLRAERGGNTNGMPTKSGVDLREVRTIGNSAVSAVTDEDLSNGTRRAGERVDSAETGIEGMPKEIDSTRSPRGRTDEKVVAQGGDSNRTARHKPRFDLLGKSQRTRSKGDHTETIRDDNYGRIVDESAIGSSRGIGGDRLGGGDGGANGVTTSDAKDDMPGSGHLRENAEYLGNDVPGAKQSPPGMVVSDLKLSLSPVVALEWLSFDGRISDEKANNDDPTKHPKPGTCSNRGERKLVRNDRTEVSPTASPSLFEDSFPLDTQLCNELEKNIDGSSGSDRIGETGRSTTNGLSNCPGLPESIRDSVDGRGTPSEITIKRVTNTLGGEFPTDAYTGNNLSVAATFRTKGPDLNDRIPDSEEIDFSWNTTTWEGSKDSRFSADVRDDDRDEAGDRVPVEGQDASSAGIVRSEARTRDRTKFCDDLDASDEITATPTMRQDRFKSVSSKSSVRNARKKIGPVDNSDSRKRKFNEIRSTSDGSPLPHLLLFAPCDDRGSSFGSNKSHSDDLIAASQKSETRRSIGKSRTRLKLESSKRAATSGDKRQNNPTLAESGRQSNIIKNKNIELLMAGDASAERRKVPYRGDRSTDGVVSDSDEDSPVRRLRVTQSLHKRTVNSSFVVGKIESPRGCKRRCLRSTVRKERSNADRTSDWSVLDIINVTWNDKIFDLFSSELKEKNEIAIALAYDKFINDTAGIGSKLIGRADTRRKLRGDQSCVFANTIVHGVAISWGRNVVYYVSLDNRKEGSVPLRARLQLLRDILQDSSLNVRCYGSKDAYKKLHRCCSITCNCKFLDPIVAEWLLECDTDERNLRDMANIHFPEGATVLHHAYSAKPAASTGPENKEFPPGRHRAAAEAAVTWHVTGKLTDKLQARSEILFAAFEDVESRVVSTLARMELTGIGVNPDSLRELSAVLQREIASLERQAYSLAGRKFSFTSSKEVAQVLGMYRGAKVSTNKAALENCDDPISNLVVSWRKLNTTQTKMVFPLLNSTRQGPRVRGCCVTRTATGRVSMHEPNLQNVPRDFSSENNSFVISMRMAFVPTRGKVMLSADYCQLELRILAHFSKDPVLCEIMSKDADIFKEIAAQWYRITIDEVTVDIRQRAKRLCYGIIYGMGSKALARQLSVTELEASRFMETFMGTYPNVNSWLGRVVTESRENGYVTTLMGRRRSLPGLNSGVKSERSQAERQAINTKIQGSAADLAKKAMVLIDDRLHEEYPDSPRVLTEMETEKRLGSGGESRDRGAHLVLQLHDELLYEVNAVDLDRVASIVKRSMEGAYRLLSPLPVKVKVGPTWGSLEEYTFPKSREDH